MNNILSF